MAQSTFSLHFRGWKDRHHIKKLKAELEDEGSFEGRAYYIYNISYEKDGLKDCFQYGDSHINWKKGKQDLKEWDLFLAIMYRLQDAEIAINTPNPCDYIKEFGYDDCCEGYKSFKVCKKAKEKLIKLFGTEDSIIQAVEELRKIEDYY